MDGHHDAGARLAAPVNISRSSPFLEDSKKADAYHRRPTSPLAFQSADEVLAFAKSLLARDPVDPLSNIPDQLLLGRQIAMRDPALSSSEATQLWHMLGRLNHLESLILEDGDGIFKDIPTAELDAASLSFSKLKHLSYSMLYTVEHCSMFLALLGDAPLQTLALLYPEEIAEEDMHPPDLSLLLSHPCLTNLASLQVRGLKFEYLADSPSLPVALRFPALNTLQLYFTSDSRFPRKDIVSVLLALFPNLSSLEMTTHETQNLAADTQALRSRAQIVDAEGLVSSLRTSTFEDARNANVAAQERVQRSLQLSNISASLLDIFILGLPCPAHKMHITEIDTWVVATYARTHLMANIFRAGTGAPHKFSITISELDITRPQVLLSFLKCIGDYWKKDQQNHVPRVQFKLIIDVKRIESIVELLDSARMNVIDNDSGRLPPSHTLKIFLRCESCSRNNDGCCSKATMFFAQVQGIVSTYSSALQNAFTGGKLQQYKIKVSTSCSRTWLSLTR